MPSLNSSSAPGLFPCCVTCRAGCCWLLLQHWTERRGGEYHVQVPAYQSTWSTWPWTRGRIWYGGLRWYLGVACSSTPAFQLTGMQCNRDYSLLPKGNRRGPKPWTGTVNRRVPMREPFFLLPTSRYSMVHVLSKVGPGARPSCRPALHNVLSRRTRADWLVDIYTSSFSPPSSPSYSAGPNSTATLSRLRHWLPLLNLTGCQALLASLSLALLARNPLPSSFLFYFHTCVLCLSHLCCQLCISQQGCVHSDHY